MNDIELLRLSYTYAADHSQDPRTKLGAVIFNPYLNTVTSLGCNKFPITPTLDMLVRPLKHKYIIHAEVNAIIHASKAGRNTRKCIMYCPWSACLGCAGAIIEAGIVKLVRHKSMMERCTPRWVDEIKAAEIMFAEAGVEVVDVEGHIGYCENTMDGIVWYP